MKYKETLFAMNPIWAILRSKLEDDIKMYYKERNREGEEWIQLAQNRLKTTSSWEHGNGLSSFAKCVEFFT